MRPVGVNDVMHQKRGLRIFGIWEKAVPASEEEGWLSVLAENRPIVCGLGTSQHRKIVTLSSCRKTFKLKKVNKSFVPKPISCFSCFGIPMFYIYEYDHSMYVSHICISGRIFGLGYTTHLGIYSCMYICIFINLCVYIYIYIYICAGLCMLYIYVYNSVSGRPGFNPRLRHTKDFENGTLYFLA